MNALATDAPLVEVDNLKVAFHGARTVHAVNGVSFTLRPGEVLGILGESGSGKSVTLKTLLRLNPEHRSQTTGSVRVADRDVLALSGKALADYRGGTASMIFQDPMLALDPVYTIGGQIAEAVCRHDGIGRPEGMRRALEMLERVRIPSPERRLKAYPHEMSGGMRQRAMIALALACRPKLLLADEPTTALDATVQIQILLLLRELQRELGMAAIFVTHDIGVAVEVADKLAVMYAGEFVETGSVRELIRDARHPYTQGLLAANLHGARKGDRLDAIPGAPPALNTAPAACSFAPRCRFVTAICRGERPPAVDLGDGRVVRCVLAQAGGDERRRAAALPIRDIPRRDAAPAEGSRGGEGGIRTLGTQ
jgi:peptide/nickel transport system ATP-binding protein